MKIQLFLLVLVSSLFNMSYALAGSAIENKDSAFNKNKKKYLVELFTSEGCSSCPPAEKKLNQFRHHPELWKSIFPLAFHVNYWDYLGWKDQYALQLSTNRQKQYAQKRQVKNVYTPQFVVNGHEAGPRLNSLLMPIVDSDSLMLDIKNDRMYVSVENSRAKTRNDNQFSNITYHVALVGMGLTSEISGGENRGITSTHDFVVLSYYQKNNVGNSWSAPIPTSKHQADNYALVVWITNGAIEKPLQITAKNI